MSEIKEGTWWRHGTSGDRHYVERHPDTGKLCFRRDLPGPPLRVSMAKKKNFEPDEIATKMLDAQKACIAYSAWESFCKIQSGMKRPKPWVGLHPQAKADWIQGKPDLEGIPLRMYRAIMIALEDL